MNSLIFLNYKEPELNAYSFIKVLMLMSSLAVFISIAILLLFQLSFISKNTTTSEELRKEKKPIPDFDTGSCKENWDIFWNRIFSYKQKIEYNENSEFYLNKNITLAEIALNNKTCCLKSNEMKDLSSSKSALSTEDSQNNEILNKC